MPSLFLFKIFIYINRMAFASQTANVWLWHISYIAFRVIEIDLASWHSFCGPDTMMCAADTYYDIVYKIKTNARVGWPSVDWNLKLKTNEKNLSHFLISMAALFQVSYLWNMDHLADSASVDEGSNEKKIQIKIP